MPLHAAKRLFKPILVLVILCTCFGIYSLLHRLSQSSSASLQPIPLPRDFANRIDHPKFSKILIKSNEENNIENVANKPAIFIEKFNDIKNSMKIDENNHEAIPAQSIEKPKTLKHERIVNGKLSRVNKVNQVNMAHFNLIT